MNTSRYVHDLSISRVAWDDGSVDEYGQPTPSAADATAVRGLVQERTAVEQDDSRSAGSEVATHVIFLPLGTDLRGDDAILYGARRFNPTGIRTFNFGRLPHLEVDAIEVTAVPVTAGGGS